MEDFEPNIDDESKIELTQQENGSQSRKAGIKREIFSWLEAMTLSIIVITILLGFVFRFSQVVGSSMVPTLHDEDRLIISHLFYTPKRGDVIVVARDNDSPLVKRIIGVGGDEINIDFEKGELYVNNVLQKEDYVNTPTTTKQDVNFPVTVPQGHFFVMGDNRNRSKDSRDSSVGMVKEENIFGKVVFRVFPFNKIGVIK
ncbi:MAG: signal peptidase I [Oscillospiraceae bacterium]